MYKMIQYEWKKIFLRTSSRIALCLLLAVVGITCIFAADVSYVDENGKEKTGPAAIAALKESQKEWAGPLDAEKLSQVIEENLRVRSTPEALSNNTIENNIAFHWGQGFSEIRNLLNCSFSEFRAYDYYRADSLTVKDASSFYENRLLSLKEWLNGEARDQFSEPEKNYLINQYENLAAPLTYDYMSGWEQLFTFAPTIVMITMLILGYLTSGIFSGEYSWKSDAIFFTSFYGRDRAVAAKIRAGFLLVTALYLAAFLLYTGILLLYLGADGWNCPVQSSWTSWKCLYNITNLQKYILIALGGYIGCLFMSFLSMLVSAKTKSAVPAVMLPVILIFLPSFIGNINSPLINKIIGLLPDQLLQTGTALNYFNLYTLGGAVLSSVPILLAIYTLLTAILLPILYRQYTSQEIG